MILAIEVANDTTAMCSNGYSGVEDTVAGVCCVQACGQCGGVGCGDIPGLSASDCCSATIETTGVQCNTVGVAPCIMSPPGESLLVFGSLDAWEADILTSHMKPRGKFTAGTLRYDVRYGYVIDTCNMFDSDACRAKRVHTSI